jgi:hypothetical protein
LRFDHHLRNARGDILPPLRDLHPLAGIDSILLNWSRSLGVNSTPPFVRKTQMGLLFHLLNYGGIVLLAPLRRLCRINVESRLCGGHPRADESRMTLGAA